MLDEVCEVHGRSDKDNEHLEIARRYAMKASALVLSDVIWELNMEHLERLHADPEWRRAEAKSIREAMHELAEIEDAEWHKMSEEADETVR